MANGKDASATLRATPGNRLKGVPRKKRFGISPPGSRSAAGSLTPAKRLNERSFSRFAGPGLRLAARTPRKRLSFTKNGVHAATPLMSMISLELGCSGPVADEFDPLQEWGTNGWLADVFDPLASGSRGRGGFLCVDAVAFTLMSIISIYTYIKKINTFEELYFSRFQRFKGRRGGRMIRGVAAPLAMSIIRKNLFQGIKLGGNHCLRVRKFTANSGGQEIGNPPRKPESTPAVPGVGWTKPTVGIVRETTRQQAIRETKAQTNPSPFFSELTLMNLQDRVQADLDEESDDQDLNGEE